MKFLDKVQAPDWFVKEMNKVEKLKKDTDKIYGIGLDKDVLLVSEKIKKAVMAGESDEYLEKLRSSEAFLLADKFKKEGRIPPSDVMGKFFVCAKYWDAIIDYAWARFRYENIDNSFGTAASLIYDDVNKVIEVRNK